MHSERLIGLLALIGTFTLAMYIFYPANKQLDINSIKNEQSNIKTEIVDTKVDGSIKGGFQIFTESDFDFFVYRAHILSSKENANIVGPTKSSSKQENLVPLKALLAKVFLITFK